MKGFYDEFSYNGFNAYNGLFSSPLWRYTHLGKGHHWWPKSSHIHNVCSSCVKKEENEERRKKATEKAQKAEIRIMVKGGSKSKITTLFSLEILSSFFAPFLFKRSLRSVLCWSENWKRKRDLTDYASLGMSRKLGGAKKVFDHLNIHFSADAELHGWCLMRQKYTQ